jgi:ATP-dependent RNA helicase RhlE
MILTSTTFDRLGLAKPLLSALAAAGYRGATPIQAGAIPELLAGRDLLGIAQTGTGKTAAFVLPLLQRLSAANRRAGPRQAFALILAPTRELVVQIGESISTYGSFLRLRHTTVIGGVNIRPQIAALRNGLDIVVATPGRLLDLIEQRHVDLSRVDHLVLDEADRMLDMGFIRDVRRIVRLLKAERQTALFSATMPGEIARLAAEVLRNPARIEIASKTVTADRIAQQVHHLPAAAKRERLSQLLAGKDIARAIVFTRTKRGADKVARHLEGDGVSSGAIHGNKSQNARQRTLEGFRDGNIRVLVATDIASRGIDIDGVTHVINYELPAEPESYVHRIGRTARAGASGFAISFCDESERDQLRSIEKLLKRPLDVVGGVPAGIGAKPSGRPAGKAVPAPRGRNRRRTRRARAA